MSAESPKRIARAVPAVVPPEPVSDRSIIDSVTGFINEVTLTSVPQIDPKEQILWVRFETSADVGNPSFGEDWDLESGVPPPLLLILGYGTGIHIWAIPANGEATEVLSWRHGIVRTLKLLPIPISYNGGESANEPPNDLYVHKRPLMAICDSSQTGSTGPHFCSMNIVSLRDGDSVKSIKFKTTILEIAANHQSVVVTFAEKIAVFDARTLEDRLTITTCHPSPGLLPNPIALGPRWLAYAERKMLPSKRSAGGCDCDGVSSYTATMLNAAKTLSKGLRDLGEQVAAGLTGTVSSNVTSVNAINVIGAEGQQFQPGIITILDIKNPIKDTSPTTGAPVTTSGVDPFIAHFVAHTEVIAAMTFDASGLLLLTADKRGHDFHVFRIHPHPCGSASAAVHHLYILHRGDTTAKVQDLVFSLDSRWAAVTTARGTTHVFPVTPYGGPATYRTHGSAEVVNRLSRFHRSAGLSVDGRSSSPVFHTDNGAVSADPYHNPRLPPFPRPYVIMPLKQLRQPLILSPSNNLASSPPSTSSTSRQRLSSVSDDAGNILRVCATFARPRDWLLHPLSSNRDIPALRNQRNAVDSLFIMAGHGLMIQYDLEPRYISSIPTAKQNDDSPIELHVEAKAQWNLLRKDTSIEIQPPLSFDNWLLKNRMDSKEKYCDADISDNDDRWLSQVEIVTSSGPHRRLWMGPQFIFKTYNTPSGSPLQHIDSEAVEIGVNIPANRPARSNPMPMPPVALGRGIVPVLIESGSASSFEQSPRLINQYQDYMGSDDLAIAPIDTQLREDLADAMRESPRDSGLPSKNASTSSSSSSARTLYVSVGKVVNPLGTVTTITESPQESILAANEFSEEYSSGAYIHENCDESMFRPYVAVISGTIDGDTDNLQDPARDRPEPIGQKLIVPVIDGALLLQQKKNVRIDEHVQQHVENVAKFKEISLLNRKEKEKKNEKDCNVSAKNEESTEKLSSDTAQTKIEKEIAKDKKNINEEKSEVKEKAISKDCKVDTLAEKAAEKKDETKNDISTENKSDETEVVTIKLKKKSSKISAKFTEPIITRQEELKSEITKPDCDKKTTGVNPTVENNKEKVSETESHVNIAKTEKSKRKTTIEDDEESPKKCVESKVENPKQLEKPSPPDEKSKESSVEIDPAPNVSEESGKSRKNNRKQKKNEKNVNATKVINPLKNVNIKNEAVTEFTFDLKTSEANSPKTADDRSKRFDDFAILDDIGKADHMDYTRIQESLLKNPVVTATVSIRKGVWQEKDDFVDVVEPKATTNSGKKKKSSRELNDTEMIALNLPKQCEEDTEFTFPQPLEPTADLDSLSFKSTTDDPISLINFESPLQETSESIILTERTNEYDKLSDDMEIGPDGQFSDCKSFQLVIDETETYLKTSDSNSSDETEDSSQGKSTKSEKILEDDDEELQPLIGSTTSQSDAAVDLSKNDALPDEINQSDSIKPQQQPASQQQQQQNNNKKKFRKKRR